MASGSEGAKAQAREYYDESFKYPFNAREALEPLSRAVELDPANEQYQHALVTRLYYTGNYAECAHEGEAFAQRGATNPEIHIFTGAAYTALGEYQKAMVAIERALKANPDNAYALYNRAMNLYYLKDARAAEAFRFYLRKAKDDPEQARYIPKANERLAELEAGASR